MRKAEHDLSGRPGMDTLKVDATRCCTVIRNILKFDLCLSSRFTFLSNIMLEAPRGRFDANEACESHVRGIRLVEKLGRWISVRRQCCKLRRCEIRGRV